MIMMMVIRKVVIMMIKWMRGVLIMISTMAIRKIK